MFHDLVQQMFEGGVAAGEFVDFEPGFVQRASNGVLFETLREQGGSNGRMRPSRPLQAADFVLRALLVDQSRPGSMNRRALRWSGPGCRWYRCRWIPRQLGQSNAVFVDGDGTMTAAADPRADGAGVVVQYARRQIAPVQGVG